MSRFGQNDARMSFVWFLLEHNTNHVKHDECLSMGLSISVYPNKWAEGDRSNGTVKTSPATYLNCYLDTFSNNKKKAHHATV